MGNGETLVGLPCSTTSAQRHICCMILLASVREGLKGWSGAQAPKHAPTPHWSENKPFLHAAAAHTPHADGQAGSPSTPAHGPAGTPVCRCARKAIMWATGSSGWAFARSNTTWSWTGRMTQVLCPFPVLGDTLCVIHHVLIFAKCWQQPWVGLECRHPLSTRTPVLGM